MSLARRTAAVVAAVLTTLCLIGAPAHAASKESIAAADYLVSTFKPGTADPYGGAGPAADALIALASTGDPRYAEQTEALVGYLKSQAAAYIDPKAGSGATAAAKLALVAAATGTDPTDFGGKDLIAATRAGIGKDGSFGAFPGPFASGLAMIALQRNSAAIPPAMVTYLLRYQEPRKTTGGGFAFCTYPFKPKSDCPAADSDSTSLAVLGLRAAGTPEALKAAEAGLLWLQDNQQADGSWKNYSPVNSTGLAGPLFPAGSAQRTRATAYVVAQQLPSGALTTGVAKDADASATQQGILALSEQSYLTVRAAEAMATPAPQSPAPSAPTGASGGPGALPFGIGALVLAAAAGGIIVARRRKRA